MTKQKKGPYDVTFDELKQLFLERCEKIGLFIHSPAFKFTPDDAFKIYLECWRNKLIRNKEMTRQTFTNWKKRGWVNEERAKDFMIYCFGNRWKSIKPNSVL